MTDAVTHRVTDGVTPRDLMQARYPTRPVGRDAAVPSLTSNLKPSCTTPGWKLLGEFNAAPISIQQAFLRAQRRELATERELVEWLADVAPDARAEPAPHVRSTRWGAMWRKRSRAVRIAQRHPDRPAPDRTTDPLLQIPTGIYVEALTGEDVPATGYMRCPLPTHDDRSPSFRVYESGWNCFACNRGGTIYDLAAALWGMETRGRSFVELQRRLREVLA